MAFTNDKSSSGTPQNSAQSLANSQVVNNQPPLGISNSSGIQLPSINLSKGGGAIRGIEEKFQVNAVSGTSSFSIPLPFSSSRSGVPAIGLSYNSGCGNSSFSLGWQLGVPSIARKTEKRLPFFFSQFPDHLNWPAICS
jgi:Salmonella virulence plasmid 65kDa B protein